MYVVLISAAAIVAVAMSTLNVSRCRPIPSWLSSSAAAAAAAAATICAVLSGAVIDDVRYRVHWVDPFSGLELPAMERRGLGPGE